LSTSASAEAAAGKASAAGPRRDVYRPHDSGRMAELAGTELASFGARAGAYACDLLLAGAIFLVGVLASSPIWERFLPPSAKVELRLDFHEWYGLLYLVLYFGLSLFWGNGKTLGKRLFRIRVVSLEHPRLTLWDCFERSLGYAASAAEAGFGFIQYFTHANHRTLHDRIADTIVVRDPRRT
jgi:uncharacterized RDD family membrane protein YckC